METSNIWILSGIIFFVAILYSTVGHGGASAYLATMALFGLTPDIMKPTALILNIIVAGIGSVSYIRAGSFSWQVFWPFALGSLPLTYWASTLEISHNLYKIILGSILIFTSLWLLIGKKNSNDQTTKSGNTLVKIIIGGAIGFIAGITGIGGGVLLSPLLILTHWADPKKTSGIASTFIVANSIVGIIGHLSETKFPPNYIWYFVATAAIGGLIGSNLGSKRLANSGIKKVLAVIMLISGVQLVGVPIYKYLKKTG